MLKHFSETEIVNYLNRNLPPADLLSADDHLAECDLCLERIATEESVRSAAVNFQKSFLNNFEDDHLTYEQIALFVDDETNIIEKEVVEVHRIICRECSTQIEDLRELQKLLRAEKEVPAAPKDNFSLNILWHQLREYSFLKFSVPALASLFIGAIIWTIWFSSESEPRGEIAEAVLPATATNQTIAPPEANSANNSINESIIQAEANQTNSNLAQPKNLIVLNDGNSRLELDETGNLKGLDASRYKAKIKFALTTQTVEISPDIKKLKSSSGVLLGDKEQPDVSFSLTSPIGKILQTARPQFRWQPLKNVESYTVAIYDEKFNRIASSEPLQTNEWRTNAPLKRGQVYQWQVTAKLATGEEIKSPARPAPDAKFKVLDSIRTKEIEQEKNQYANSHLLLGILYANAGLLDEAAVEFQKLLNKNPQSDLARKFLRQVQSKR